MKIKCSMQIIENNSHRHYLGIRLSNRDIKAYLNTFKKKVGEKKYHLYTNMQKKRDRDIYHITTITPDEYETIIENVDISNFSGEYFVELIGVGMVSNDANEAYFIIVESEKLQIFRKNIGLPQKDFHVTLGFKLEDIHHVSKAIETMI